MAAYILIYATVGKNGSKSKFLIYKLCSFHSFWLPNLYNFSKCHNASLFHSLPLTLQMKCFKNCSLLSASTA